MKRLLKPVEVPFLIVLITVIGAVIRLINSIRDGEINLVIAMTIIVASFWLSTISREK